MWSLPPRFPVAPAVRSSLLLLHSSGRYLYRPQASHDPGDVAAARFVGVNQLSIFIRLGKVHLRESSTAESVSGASLPLLTDSSKSNSLSFLDLRQVAEGVQFVILDVPHILLADLPRLVRIRPPPGWALHVTGGRRRRNRIDVTNADTLVIGYKYVCDSDGL